jgi:oligosaccharide repeat unit polymerase
MVDSDLLAATCATAIGLILIRYRHPISLCNFYLVYVWALCVLGPVFFGYPGETTAGWSMHFIVLAIIFVVSWGVGGRWPLPQSRRGTITAVSSTWTRTIDDLLTGTVILLILLQCLVVLVNIRRFGISAYYSGALLVEQIQSYGQASSGGAAYQVVTFALTVITNAVLFFLVTRAYLVGAATAGDSSNAAQYAGRLKNVALRLCFAWLVLVPLIQFSRSGLVYGAIAYLAARSYLKGRTFSLPLIAVGTVAIAFFSIVGLVRESSLGGTAGIGSIFASEVSPWIAYQDIQENIEYLGYQEGRTILIPMLLKFAPRGLVPDKPQNSGGYYMDLMYPDRFDAGFALAPTYLGDLFLNFGKIGVLAGTAILGLLTGVADSLVRRAPERYLGYYLVCLFYYVSVLRDALANSLFNLFSSLIVLFAISVLARALYSLNPSTAEAPHGEHRRSNGGRSGPSTALGEAG